MKAVIVAGLGFGDEGKGTTVEYLAAREKAHTVVRYNGGCQATHNIVLSDGRHHTFSQFGSATFQGVHTYLSKFVLVDPLSFIAEAKALRQNGVIDPFKLVTFDENAPIVTPYHRAVNRLKEISRYDKMHGSCGVGIGECMDDLLRFKDDAPRIGDLRRPRTFRGKMELIRGAAINKIRDLDLEIDFADLELEPDFTNFDLDLLGMTASSPERWMERYEDEFTQFADIKPEDFLQDRLSTGVTIFEGAQGVLLDQEWGFRPHTTWTDTTFRNAFELMKCVCPEVERVGVIRSHMTRHGAGPFPTEDKKLVGSDFDSYNTDSRWQGSFRVGPLDLELVKYSINILGGVDSISLTNLDRVVGFVCTEYRNRPRWHKVLRDWTILNGVSPIYHPTSSSASVEMVVRDSLKVPFIARSYGPRLEDKKP